MADAQGWERSELLNIYQLAVEEYRFQVRLNWNRTQYLFALNAAVLAAGATLASAEEAQRPQLLVAAVFLVGILAALQAIAITQRQHQYYRNARDHMQHVASEVGLGDMRLRTTPGMRGGRAGKLSKLGRVTWMHYGLFTVFGVLHVAGIVQVLA